MVVSPEEYNSLLHRLMDPNILNAGLDKNTIELIKSEADNPNSLTAADYLKHRK